MFHLAHDPNSVVRRTIVRCIGATRKLLILFTLTINLQKLGNNFQSIASISELFIFDGQRGLQSITDMIIFGTFYKEINDKTCRLTLPHILERTQDVDDGVR